ncbi:MULTISPECIES: ABC transporter substrate-binding protein [Rhodomicrobium]|uniref:ABC transporter substrate-binding protein n=1 Tax=Rhodomicrobium TaxID=1068 RepID=UPI001FD88B88|nr:MULTISPECIES: ABC transporter substrate-binding protein [Rhodomicrobium]
MADAPSPAVVKDLAPTGPLRVAINYGNPVLAQKDPASGEPRGVSAELARELAKRLGSRLEFTTFDSAGKVFDALGTWDVAFLAIDPVRAAGISFTPPYVIIEGTYLVPDASALKTIEDVDREGVRVAVGKGSAYDLYLTRELKRAQIVRAPSSAAALDLFVQDKLEVAAGVKQPLVGYAASRPGLRVVPGRFMVINQAIGIPKGRDLGAPFLRDFVEEMKASGFVAKALAASGQADATVAPPAAAQ